MFIRRFPSSRHQTVNLMLTVTDLKTHFFTRKGTIKAVDGISFQLDKGETLGLAGESGCGKTTAALSLIRLVPSPGEVVGGQVLLDGLDILKLTEDELREVRWKKISLIFQGAMNALNPLFTVGNQIGEAIMAHEETDPETASVRVAKLLEMVRIDPERVGDYPHQLSGGMKQRVMIAMALACQPQVLIADEPATALDVIVQSQILKLIAELQKRLQVSMILITHDLSVLAETASKIAIMYAGNIVEYADTRTVFRNPRHPYTRALIECFPSIREHSSVMKSISGSPPNLLNPPSGCKFHPRCPYAKTICSRESPPVMNISPNHFSMCHFAGGAS